MKIGIISDTHDYFDPRIPAAFEGVEHILHGGDIGLPSILNELKRIAPVTAVCGNTDDPRFGYRMTETVELGGIRFLLHHIVNPYSLTDEMQHRITAANPRVVIFGHTHKVFDQDIGATRFLNPGYAGKTRFGLQRSLAILRIQKSSVCAEFITL